MQKGGYTLDEPAICQRATLKFANGRPKEKHTSWERRGVVVAVLPKYTCFRTMGGNQNGQRKPTQKWCELGIFLLWGNNINHCSTVPSSLKTILVISFNTEELNHAALNPFAAMRLNTAMPFWCVFLIFMHLVLARPVDQIITPSTLWRRHKDFLPFWFYMIVWGRILTNDCNNAKKLRRLCWSNIAPRIEDWTTFGGGQIAKVSGPLD